MGGKCTERGRPAAEGGGGRYDSRSMSEAQKADKSSAVPPGASTVITIRRLAPSDSIQELTELLHRAYAKQVEMGLRPLAGRQDAAMTKKRVFSGECYVAVEHVPKAGKQTLQRLVGTILFHEVEESQGPPFFSVPGVSCFSQFAVDPSMQGRGVGLRLLNVMEAHALDVGANELACTMAEPDTDLMNFYLRRGYRLVGHWQWPYTNYRSAILSKALTNAGG